MKKKWLTKAELDKLIKTYSVRSDEFKEVSQINYCYQSNLIKGYMLKIAPEPYSDRILVTHTQSNGKRFYVDVWQRDKNQKLQFMCRNLQNQPISDAQVIKDLQKEVEELKNSQSQNIIIETKTVQPVPVHNARGAGRKPSKERLKAIEHVKELIEAGHSDREIMEEMQISRATFFRYKRSIQF